MKQLSARFTAAFFVLVLSLACLAGCRTTVGRTDSEITAVVFEGKKYSLEEAKLYIYASQFEVEKNSEFIIAYMYGSYESFWELDQNGATYYELNFIEGINKMFQTKRLLLQAAESGITLSDEEKAAVDRAFDAFKEERASVLEAAGCSDETLRTYLSENALAVKTYLSLVSDVDTTFDSDTFRRKNVEGCYVSAITDKPLPEDAAEDAVAEQYTEEEQNAAREEAVAAVRERMQAGEAVSDIVSDYSESETVHVYSTGNLTISPSDAPEEDADPTGYRQFAWTLSTGDLETYDSVSSTGAVTTYILHCVDDDDADMRKTAEDSELTSRKSALFAERYAALSEKYDDYYVYGDALAKIKKIIPLYDSEMLNPTEAE